MTSALPTQQHFGASAQDEGRARLSVCCMTAGPPERVAATLSLLRDVADEVVVALDDRADDDVRDAMSAVADRILLYPYAEPVDRPIPWLHTECRGTWVLNLDDDEVPSPDLVAALPSLVSAEDVTHYWIPRRWLFPDLDTYLDELPWQPDYQLRLVRNDPRLLRFSADLHRPLAVLGPGRFLETPVWHLDCVVRPLEVRRAKAAKYERLRPGLRVRGRALNAAYFLPELQPGATLTPVPSADRAAIESVVTAELPPGTSAVVPAHVRAPTQQGRYRLELDLVHEHVRWFGCEIATEVDVVSSNRVAVVGGDDAAESVLRLLERHPELEPVLVARDEGLPWEPPGHSRAPGVRSYLFGGDPDQPGSVRLGITVVRRSFALARRKELPPTAAQFIAALAGCRLLVVAGIDAPEGAPPPRELPRIAALVSAARRLNVPVAVQRNALPGSNRLAVRTLRRLVLSRATMVYGDDEELD